MQYQWNTPNAGGFWFGPVAIGVLLILFGVLVLVVPRMLEIIVAGVLLMGGLTMVGLGLSLRGRTVYRRVDDDDRSM